MRGDSDAGRRTGVTDAATAASAGRTAAAAVLQARAEDITLREGQAVAVNGSSVALATLARQVHQRSDLFDGFNLAETAAYDPGGTFSNACHAAIVEVDRDARVSLHT